MSQTQRAHRARGARALNGSAPFTLEYAILAVLIAAIAVGTWKTLGEPPAQEDAAPIEQR